MKTERSYHPQNGFETKRRLLALPQKIVWIVVCIVALKAIGVSEEWTAILTLLAVLSYNVGEYRLLGYGKQPKSRLVQKLESGDRDIRSEYISFCRYRGKELKALRLRRRVELALLYEK